MSGLTRRNWISIGLVTLFLVGWAVLVFLISPERLVQALGVENAYLAVFALSVVGALGSMTTFSSYPAIVAFAAGGMNVLALGAISALGLTVGDAIFYSLVGEVETLLRGRARERARKVRRWLDDRPAWALPLVVYVWVGLLPLANNILTGGLALSGLPFRRIVVPVFFGNLTFPTVVAWLASQGIQLFG